MGGVGDNARLSGSGCFLEMLQYGPAIFPSHDDIEENQIGKGLGEQRVCLGSGARSKQHTVMVLQVTAIQIYRALIVIDHQDTPRVGNPQREQEGRHTRLVPFKP